MNTVLFDLDGTLVDTICDLGAAAAYTMDTYGLKSGYTHEDYKLMVGNGVYKLMERAFAGRIPEEELPAALAVFKEYYNAHLLDCSAAYPGIVKLLKHLKADGFRLAVVTNKPDDSAKKIVSALFEPGLIDCVSGQRPELPAKPAPAQVRYALAQLGVNFSDCVFVGDSKTDIETAQNCAVPGIGVLWGFRGKEELIAAGADFVADSPKTLEKILKDMKNSIDI